MTLGRHDHVNGAIRRAGQIYDFRRIVGFLAGRRAESRTVGMKGLYSQAAFLVLSVADWLLLRNADGRRLSARK